MARQKSAHLLIAVVLGACASNATATDGPREETALDYFPVPLNAAWSYYVIDHRLEGQGRVLLTSRVAEVTPDSVTIDSVRQRVKYEIHPNGIYKPQSKYYVLRSPIVEGAKWDVPGGGEVRIESAGNTLDLLAGRIENCILVVEELYELQRAELYYARGIGLVKMTYFDLRAEGSPVAISGELLSYALEPVISSDLPDSE